MRNAYEVRSNGHGQARGWDERDETRSFRGRGYDDDRPMMMGQRARRDTISHSNVVKVIEVLAESEHSWEDAAQMALREASRTIRNIKSIYVKDMQAVVREGRIVCYRLDAKISFALEGNREQDDYDMREDRYGRY